MARQLREQFALATLLLLIPVSGVILWAGRNTYNEQLLLLGEEASQLAASVAAEAARPGADAASVDDYMKRMSWPSAAVAIVTDAQGHVLARYAHPRYSGEELTPGRAVVKGTGWLVNVNLPTPLANQRAMPIYWRTVTITAVATLIMIVLEAVFLRRWLPSLRHLERSADRVGAGDLQTPARVAMPSREFEHVRDAFAGMVDNVREAREEVARQVEYERRLREEMQSLQQQIIRQERLAAIGTLLSGIAHELNNPLQAISGLAEVLQRDRLIRDDVRGDLGLIQKESRRASAIIRNLSRFGRQTSATPTTVILGDVIASVVELRHRRFLELNITLTVEDRAAQPAHAVFAELQQVLLNFVANAEYAVTSPGVADRRIVIRTLDHDDRVRVEVDDSGSGVPLEDEPKLFQPFHTTKPIGEGTGLGLSVSYGIMRSCGGTIGYQSPPGGGARFFFEVPAEPDHPVPGRRAVESAVPVIRR